MAEAAPAGFPGPPDDLAERGAEVVRGRTDIVPQVALVLGSGLGPALGDDLEVVADLPFTDLPGFPPTGVPGHAGRLLLGWLAGVTTAAFSGRVHFYEGHGMDVPALLPRLARALGARTMVLTGAVGGLEEGVPAGTLIVLRDHVNMMGTAPLRGWRFPDGAPAFVNTAAVYDRELADLTLGRAEAIGVAARPGIYAAMSGPAYETPTEISMLRGIGATVVGMSMVPEALPALALGMRVLGLCSLTNAYGTHVTHEEVVRIAEQTAIAVGRLLVDLFPRLPTPRGAIDA